MGPERAPDVHGEADVGRLGVCLGRAQARLHEPGEVGAAGMDMDRGAGGHEKVRDQGQEPLRVALRHFDAAYHRAVQALRVGEHQVQVADDGRQRRAEFVGDGGNHLVLRCQGVHQAGDLVENHYGAAEVAGVVLQGPGSRRDDPAGRRLAEADKVVGKGLAGQRPPDGTALQRQRGASVLPGQQELAFFLRQTPPPVRPSGGAPWPRIPPARSASCWSADGGRRRRLPRSRRRRCQEWCSGAVRVPGCPRAGPPARLPWT